MSYWFPSDFVPSTIVVGSIYDDRNFEKRPVTLIIDEFASFATPDLGEFIEKARGAGIGVIVA